MNDIARMISKLELQRATIDRAISALREIEQQNPTPFTGPPAASAKNKPQKRRLSAEGRRRIIEGNKRYWAKKRAVEATQSSKPAKKLTAPKKTSRKRRPA